MKRVLSYVLVFALGAICTLALVDSYVRERFGQLTVLGGPIAIFDRDPPLLSDGGRVTIVEIERGPSSKEPEAPPTAGVVSPGQLGSSVLDGGGSVDGGADDSAAPTGPEKSPADTGTSSVGAPFAIEWGPEQRHPLVDGGFAPTVIRGSVTWGGALLPQTPVAIGPLSDCGEPMPQNWLQVDSGRHLADAVVRFGSLSWSRRRGPTPARPTVQVKSEHCRFVPHIQLLPERSRDPFELTVTDGDARVRDIEGLSQTETGPEHLFTHLLPGLDQSFTVTVPATEDVMLRDDAFPLNHAYVITRWRSAVSLTAADGTFEIETQSEGRCFLGGELSITHYDPDATVNVSLPYRCPSPRDLRVSVVLQ